MISGKENDAFIINLWEVKEEVSKLKKIQMTDLVKRRLNKSLQTYSEQIQSSCDLLSRKNAIRVARALNKRGELSDKHSESVVGSDYNR